MLAAAVAQEPLLLVGPPGTAKSDLVLKFKDALGIADDDYFEYMLTRFTEPSEIIGPIDINQLRDGRYIRREQGKLPTARLAFLDEIFKSNSAILNILLTIINERKFYQDGVPEPVRLCVLFAATNEIPEQGELAALKDRFVLKAVSNPVQENHFEELIDMGQPQSEAVDGRSCRADRYSQSGTVSHVSVRQEAARRQGGAERPATLFPGGRVPRISASRQDAGARGSHLYQRPQTREAL